MTKEIELKLTLLPDHADAAGHWLTTRGEITHRSLHSVYFDTPAQFLLKSGMTLRLRHDGHQWIQTIKSGSRNGVGLFDRDEWEKPVPDRAIDIADTPLAGLPPQTRSAMAETFSLDVERRVVLAEHDGSTVEIALDMGTVKAADRYQALSEAELELKSGSTDALFDLARSLDAIAPIRIGVRAKSDLGYGLLGPLEDSVKADAVRIDPNGSVEDAFFLIASSCIAQYRLNEDILLRRQTPEALHQARVGLRRLRSALKIFKAVLDPHSRDAFNDELKWLAGILGTARDLDIKLAAMPQGPEAALVQEARDAAYRTLGETLIQARPRLLMLDIVQWLTDGAASSAPQGRAAAKLPVVDLANSALDKLFRKLKASAKGFAVRTDQERHETRKLAKTLRYGTEFFAAVYDGKRKAKHHQKLSNRLGALQDALGELNDLTTIDTEVGRTLDKSVLLATASERLDEVLAVKRFWS
ncbi:CHAD domain-containing protein [Pelagibacterium luteolum]|uniref:Inorganic triphosphatase YgiF, contains CYTH and CHAD domains n=1 Tax=Pelagibacterium luteolum TaxID=440168 RepID=A0A1G7RSR1_9HYPH|nr:CHAD domain-containing protein [Pelagibacterium luteolum]SDG13725.1 Inorganic triphosphatase YgiF, contains CYTH and CHAD domains [Pelagibacterium luteolum]